MINRPTESDFVDVSLFRYLKSLFFSFAHHPGENPTKDMRDLGLSLILRTSIFIQSGYKLLSFSSHWFIHQEGQIENCPSYPGYHFHTLWKEYETQRIWSFLLVIEHFPNSADLYTFIITSHAEPYQFQFATSNLTDCENVIDGSNFFPPPLHLSFRAELESWCLHQNESETLLDCESDAVLSSNWVVEQDWMGFYCKKMQIKIVTTRIHKRMAYLKLGRKTFSLCAVAQFHSTPLLSMQTRSQVRKNVQLNIVGHNVHLDIELPLTASVLELKQAIEKKCPFFFLTNILCDLLTKKIPVTTHQDKDCSWETRHWRLETCLTTNFQKESPV